MAGITTLLLLASTLAVAIAQQPNNPAEWTTAPWSDCSATCGRGFQNRRVTCNYTQTHALAPDSLCVKKDTSKPPIVQVCYTVACPPTIYYVRGPCSRTCGGGVWIPSKRCRQTNRFGEIETVPEQVCAHINAPPLRTLETCGSVPCPASYRISAWSSCSSTCGEGRQTRRVRCTRVVRGRRFSAPQRLCRVKKNALGVKIRVGKPRTVRRCHNEKLCPGNYKWLPSKWSLCHVNCEKKRRVKCFSDKDGRNVHESFCKDEAKPTLVTRCINTAAMYGWKSSAWGECSVTCGSGYQYRQVYCINVHNGQKARSCPKCLEPQSARQCNTFRSCHASPIDQSEALSVGCKDKAGYCSMVEENPELFCDKDTMKETCGCACQ